MSRALGDRHVAEGAGSNLTQATFRWKKRSRQQSPETTRTWLSSTTCQDHRAVQSAMKKLNSLE